MDLINRTFFIADAKKFVADTQSSQMQIFDNSTKQKMEKKEQMSINGDEKREGVCSENRLIKQVKIKNEFLSEAEKNRKRVKKSYRECVKSRMGEYYKIKPSRLTSKHKKKKRGQGCSPYRET